jgi:hypothetical protein
VVLEAMIDKQHIGGALLFASDELRKNRRFIMESVMQNGEALKHASEDMRAYRAVVMAAVKQSGWALEYASAKMRGDRGVVMAAVKQRGGALQVRVNGRGQGEQMWLWREAPWWCCSCVCM